MIDLMLIRVAPERGVAGPAGVRKPPNDPTRPALASPRNQLRRRPLYQWWLYANLSAGG